jgi:hypothetical protein
MRKFLVGIPAAALLVVVLVAATMAACDGGADEPAASSGSTSPPRDTASSTTSSTSADPTSTTVTGGEASSSESPAPAPAPAPPAAATPAPAPAPDEHFVCPEGGMAEVTALQDAVDQGHQPWRLSSEDVAAGCTFGLGSTVEPVGPSTYRVTDASTGETVQVELAQPLGPDGIWVVTSAHPV